jgi:N-acetylmuramate 1-kinase
MADREMQSRTFLLKSGWGNATRGFLAADSSTRSYDRLFRGNETAVLMDAPPPTAEDPAIFLSVAEYLAGCGLSPPKCMAKDLPNGFLLLEDLGDGIFARLIETDPSLEVPLYRLAVQVLLHLQKQEPLKGLENLTAADWGEAACFALDWYRFGIVGDRCAPDAFRDAVTSALQRHADGPRVMILRDYHAENLLWLPDRQGLAQVGLLDFQLAQLGQPGYDLVSLLQDARRDVSLSTEAAMIRYVVEHKGYSEAEFAAAYAALGAQRALRIIGIFARLCLNGAKPGYLRMIPRVWEQLWRNLAAPELSKLAELCRELLPEPTPENLATIGAQCGSFR